MEDVGKKIYENKKLRLLFTVLTAFVLLGCIFQPVANTEVVESSIVTFIVYALVGVVVAVNLMPTIANQTATLESNADLDSSEQGVVGLWDLLVIIGVTLAIIKMAL